MTSLEHQEEEKQEKRAKGRKWIPALCSVCGTILFLLVIAAFLPLALPRLLGYDVYEVVSGSMEPAIPKGSLICVRSAEPEELETGDIAVYRKEGSIVTHRVVENRYVEGELITKGDANAEEDPTTVPYQSVIGKVSVHVPVMGSIMTLVSGKAGKLYAALLLASGLLFHLLASALRRR